MASIRDRLLRRLRELQSQRAPQGPLDPPSPPPPPKPWAPRWPMVRVFDDARLDPALRAALADGSEDAIRELVTEIGPGLYTLRLLDADWCAALLDEVRGIEDWAAQPGAQLERPNSMNDYGVLLEAFGLGPAMAALTREVIRPLATELFPEIGGASLDGCHPFVVTYAPDKDRSLSFHVDDSEVTVNLCLGDRFTGGDLYLRGRRCPQHLQTRTNPGEELDYAHAPGVALLHAGSHRHGAWPIHEGERYNLILWCRSAAYRSDDAHLDHSACPDWCAAPRGSD